MFKPLKVILVYFVCLIFTGCEKSEKKEESVQDAAPQAASSEASESPELSEFKARIGIVADRYFPWKLRGEKRVDKNADAGI